MDPGQQTSRRAAAPPVRHILVPTDFSDDADDAFAYALRLARSYGAEIDLLHVIGAWQGDPYGPLQHLAKETGAGGEEEEQSANRVIYNLLTKSLEKQDTEGVRVDVVKRRGGTVPKVLAFAEREAVDLIVMWTHGRSGTERLFLGSVAEKIVRRAPCSVVTVSAHATPVADEIRRILVPVDFSESSVHALYRALDVAERFGARIDLLHVLELLPFLDGGAGFLTVSDLVDNAHENLRARLDRLIQRTAAAVPVEGHLEEGHVPTTIVDVAEGRAADLIVMGMRGLSRTERFLLGSVTERVLRAASCPVWVVRDAEASAGDGAR